MQICIPSLFSLDLAQRLCQAFAISLPLSQNFPQRAAVWNLYSIQGDQGQGVDFLRCIVKEAEEKYFLTTLRYSLLWLVGQFVSFLVILPTSTLQFILWRELLCFMERKDGCCAGAGLELHPQPGWSRCASGPVMTWCLQQLRQWEVEGRKMDIDFLTF